ncbi:MAG: helix-turn-helix domain-containing protein [Nitrososphaerales archaeon]
MELEFETKIKASLKSNLKQARAKQKLSQEQLSTKCGIHRVSIARYESGNQTPSVIALYALASALNVNVARLIRLV